MRMLLEYHRSYKRYERIAVYRLAVTSYYGRAVNVGVEYHSEVGIAVSHGTANRTHCLGILRIGYMIGESSVGIEELTTFGVGSQLAQYTFEESSAAVACIHHYVHSLKRMFIVVGMHALTDIVSNVARVYCHEVKCG